MTRIRTYGRITAVLNDEDQTIILRTKRPESGGTIVPGPAEKDRAIIELDLRKELDQGYKILDERTE